MDTGRDHPLLHSLDQVLLAFAPQQILVPDGQCRPQPRAHKTGLDATSPRRLEAMIPGGTCPYFNIRTVYRRGPVGAEDRARTPCYNASHVHNLQMPLLLLLLQLNVNLVDAL